MAEYTVQSTVPTVYLDKAGKAVQGYLVYVYFHEFDEVHQVNTPSLSPTLVKAAAEALLKDRKALVNLGNSKA